MRLVASTIAIALLTACTGGNGEDSGTDENWWETDVVAGQSWGLKYAIGGRSIVALTADNRAVFGHESGELRMEPAPLELPERLGPFDASLDDEWGTPVIGDGVAMVRNASGDLAAIDLEDDALLWQSVDHRPVMASVGGTAVAVLRRNSTDPALRALNPRTGEVRWTIDEDASVFAPVGTAGGLVCGFSDGELVVLDADDGQELGRASTGLQLEYVEGEACQFDGTDVVVLGRIGAGAEAELARFAQDGTELARVAWTGVVHPEEFGVRADGTIVAWSAQDLGVYDSGLQLVDMYDDRSLRGMDRVSGNMLYGSILVDADFQPIWAAEIELPREAYRFMGATVVGETVYWTDTQEGILGVDRWTRTLAFTTP